MKDIFIDGVKVESWFFADIIPHDKNLTFWHKPPVKLASEKTKAQKRANRFAKRDYYNAYARRWYREHKIYKKIYSKLYQPRATQLARDRRNLRSGRWIP